MTIHILIKHGLKVIQLLR